MVFINRFIWLIFAHFIGDGALQSEWVAVHKGRKPHVMFGHAMIYVTCVSVVLQGLGIYAFWKVPFIVIGHMCCDWVKCDARERSGDKILFIWLDQVFHLIQLLVVYFL